MRSTWRHGAARTIVPVRFRNDMLHIAVATVADEDVVVSWMTSKTSRPPGPGTDIAMDAVAWVRAVRDAMYADTSTLTAAEFIQYVRRAARTTEADDTPVGAPSGTRPA